jgi:hypothetical protein
LLAALVALAASSCATLPPCPARGGPVWTEWSSPHVVLLTDLDEDDARAALRDFEELRSAVLAAAWRRAPEPRGPITVVVVRSDRELYMFLPSGVAARVVVTRSRQAFILKSGAERDRYVTGPIVRLLSYHFGLGRLPWFEEGLARYLEGLRLEKDGTLTYGDVDPVLFHNVTHGELTDFEHLWEPRTAENEQPLNKQSFIATSWLAVHYLFNHEPDRFLVFEMALASARDPRAAWRATFPDLTPEVMNQRLAEYAFHSGQFTSFRGRLPPEPFEPRATPMPDAAAHALRAMLLATTAAPRPDLPDLARAEVGEALRLDATNVLAAYVDRELLGGDASDIDLPKRLVAAHPSSATAWLLLSHAREARHETDEAHEAWEEMLRAGGAPDAPVVLESRVARPD